MFLIIFLYEELSFDAQRTITTYTSYNIGTSCLLSIKRGVLMLNAIKKLNPVNKGLGLFLDNFLAMV